MPFPGDWHTYQLPGSSHELDAGLNQACGYPRYVKHRHLHQVVFAVSLAWLHFPPNLFPTSVIVTKPLRDLTKKNARIWQDEQECAFCRIKELLTSDMVMAYFYANRTGDKRITMGFIITVYARSDRLLLSSAERYSDRKRSTGNCVGSRTSSSVRTFHPCDRL